MNGEIKSPVTMTLMMLPNDLLLNCLARVSRLYYPTLFLVSKSFRSLLASLELYQTRTLLNRTENCLYICLGFDNNPRWFILSQKPTQISDRNPKPRWYSLYINALHRFLKNCFRNKEKKLRGNIFVSVPTRSPPYVGWNLLVTIGYNIYNFEKFSSDMASSKVMFMDCRSHTWHEAPSMLMARENPHVTVLDGKIYVVGGNKDCDSSNWMEFFDPKTQVWQYVQSPEKVIYENRMYRSLAIEGKLYLVGQKSVVYKPSMNRWDEFNLKDSIYAHVGWHWGSCCVTDNVFYCLGLSEMLEWYDFEGGRWRVLTGLKKLPKLPRKFNSLRVVNYDGTIAVLWEKEVGDEKEIWYADISLKRRSKQEIRGKIEWCDIMFIVPKSCEFLQFLSVMV